MFIELIFDKMLLTYWCLLFILNQPRENRRNYGFAKLSKIYGSSDRSNMQNILHFSLKHSNANSFDFRSRIINRSIVYKLAKPIPLWILPVVIIPPTALRCGSSTCTLSAILLSSLSLPGNQSKALCDQASGSFEMTLSTMTFSGIFFYNPIVKAETVQVYFS